jgi:hypothetical protein
MEGPASTEEAEAFIPMENVRERSKPGSYIEVAQQSCKAHVDDDNHDANTDSVTDTQYTIE